MYVCVYVCVGTHVRVCVCVCVCVSGSITTRGLHVSGAPPDVCQDMGVEGIPL